MGRGEEPPSHIRNPLSGPRLYPDTAIGTSELDILIIAMACELVYVGRAEDTFLVTCDRRIQKVVEQFRTTDIAKREGWKIPSPMDDHGVKRWAPPNVLYLPTLKSGQIRPVQGQPPLNL